MIGLITNQVNISFTLVFEELKDYYYSYSYNRETIQSKVKECFKRR